MGTKWLMWVVPGIVLLFAGLSLAEDPPEDPFGGGFAVNQDVELFTLGMLNDSLQGRGFDWFSAEDSIYPAGAACFPESYQCGEDRDIAAADFDGDFLDELVVAWNRTDGGIFVGIPTIDPLTLEPDPGGWNVPDVPITAGVLYASETLAEVLGEIRVVAGNFYDDPAMEFVLAYLAADSTVSMTVFDVDMSSLTPEAKGSISDQAIHTVMPEIQRFGTASRFDVATGDLDNDGTDEIVLIASDPAVSPGTDLVINIYDYDTTSQTLSRVSQNAHLANMRASEVSCLRRIASTTGDFDADSLEEVAFVDDWARADKDTLHYACAHVLDIDTSDFSIADAWDRDTVGFAHLSPGNGVSWRVHALTIYNGDLIVGGEFDSAGGVHVNRIARWDGTQWHALATGLDNTVRALTVYDGDLIAGGDFLFADPDGENINARRIARWDGSQWHAIVGGNEENGFLDNVHALTVYDNELIAAGEFLWAEWNGNLVNTRRIARWDGSQWRPIGEGMSSTVYALTVYNDTLIAAGQFDSAGGVHVNCIASWDGSQWHAMGEGVNDPVRALTVYGDDLLVGGQFVYAYNTGETVTARRIASWDGTSWDRLGGGLSSTVRALTVYGSDLLVGGDFVYADIHTPDTITARRIASWDGTSWDRLSGGMSSIVRAVTVHDGNLVAAGDFFYVDPYETNIPVRRIAGWDSTAALWGYLQYQSDFVVDILADDVDFAPNGADEIILHAQQVDGTGIRLHDVFMVFGVDDGFSGCIRSGNYIELLFGKDGIHGSRRTMAVGDFVSDENSYKELVFLRGELDLPEATVILACSIDTTVLAACDSPDDDSLPRIAYWTDSSGSITELVAADIDTGTIVVGNPDYHLVTDMLQPLVVLNAPPCHFDILDETVYDVNFMLDETPNPQGCETYSVYEKNSGYTLEMSSEVNRDWGLSSSLDVSVGTPGADVQAHLGGYYGESSTWAEESRQTINFTLTANALSDDQIFATQLNYEVWEYPILKGGVQLDGGGVVVVSPVVSNNIFAASKSSFREQWIPNHEVGNLLSYPKVTDDNVMVGSDSIICDGTGFVTNDVSQFYWEVIEEDFSGDNLEKSWSAGMEVGASVETGGSFFGFSWGVEVSTEFTYDASEVNTYSTEVTDACLLGAYIGCVNTTPSSDRTSIIIPYAYWANNGALVLDYTVQPSAPVGDPSFWEINYGVPDPAFILPWRLDKEKGDEDLSETYRYRTREIIFHPGKANPGELVTITARVHNFSLVPTLSSVAVSFYFGDPDNGGTLLADPYAQSVFWTADPVPSQGERLVTMDWQVPDAGSVSGCQRIWAVIDPDNSISPEVHDNDDPRTNNKGWNLLYVNTDDICVDPDGDGLGDPTFPCHTCDSVSLDNCPTVYNPDQTDSNGDGIGDACQGCCGIYTGGITGNANCSDDGKLTLSDISRMIDFLYISKAALCCYASGNTNGSWDDGDCKITLSDVSKLIDALYISKQPTADCMPECER